VTKTETFIKESGSSSYMRKTSLLLAALVAALATPVAAKAPKNVPDPGMYAVDVSSGDGILSVATKDSHQHWHSERASGFFSRNPEASSCELTFVDLATGNPLSNYSPVFTVVDDFCDGRGERVLDDRD